MHALDRDALLRASRSLAVVFLLFTLDMLFASRDKRALQCRALDGTPPANGRCLTRVEAIITQPCPAAAALLRAGKRADRQTARRTNRGRRFCCYGEVPTVG